ncbi:cyclopropane-fatty-acyl-phospholipid synthase family protein [Neorhizobium sp. CSC1952]|uniref:Cyclopropane-fatty-acyl-phospholipid synthase n=1 Tax=Xaviernesmea oryzae TaxID=464029 RepID=A0A1X7F4R8_9HYPH|nr:MULTISPECIES: cyclopropane-fatty-acyl-phospholipid synthase family protein [Rhizobium/Agrobacterium group]WJR67926.1 cyclopropane-fatty-acyl-phospholipid synthase family protein [Rhizobium sp. CSC1952]SMF45610.1 cyclopropane-fatty-acyl-phospholipid synthase [Xaviernesmea oryzae]
MASSLHNLLNKIIKTGTLTVRGSGGEQRYGGGGGRTVTIRFTDEAAERELVNDPQLKLGELYMEGRLLVEQGDIYDLLALVKDNTLAQGLSFGMIWRGIARIIVSQFRNRVPINHNRRNVAHHYDLDEKLFSLFLDEDWQYSCAYFNPPGISLDEAQLAKKRHIVAKLLAEPGQKALEIGSGWGGMAMYLAESSGVDVTGITLSTEQLKISRERAAKRGLANSVRFELQDYYYLPADKSYDRIVSVGMFEHVGRLNYRKFFNKVNDVLADDGVMLLHSIGQPYPAIINNPWIEKYIFPGGYIPSIAEVMPAVEKAGLLVSDIEILPMHYAYTLRHWRQRFMANKEKAAAIYDERFVRMWEFYLAGSEMAFTHEKFFIFQMQIVKKRTAVPDNRNYIYEREAELKAFEQRRVPLDKIAV